MNKKYYGLVGFGAVIAITVVVSMQYRTQTPSGTTLGTEHGAFNREQGNTGSALVSSAQSLDKSASVFIASQKELAELELSDELKLLLGLTETPAPYSERAKVLRALYSKELSADEVLALRSLLELPLSEFGNMRPIEANALKNDALGMLLELDTLPEGLADQMVAMATGSEHDAVWQDYCVQFMPVAWEKLQEEHGTSNTEHSASNDNESDQAVDSLQAAMESALDKRDSTIAGTALIGLELLARTNDQFDQELITEKTIEITADESASASCRLTAMRMASLLGNDEVLPSTRMLAQTGETVLLQCAAITTLGEFGADEDVELLESLSQSSNKQIASAATAALKKM